MSNFINLLLEDQVQADWIVKLFPILRTIFVFIIIACAIVLIITTLMQSSAENNGTAALSGQDSYFSKNKGESKDVRLKRVTIAMSITIAVCSLLYFISLLINATK